MQPRVVEIASSNRYLSLYRGFLKVSKGSEELGRVAISDIGVLVINAHGISYSNDLMVSLAKYNIPVILCGRNHMPVSWLWPTDAHHLQAQRMDAQLSASLPTKKRMWQMVVRKKIAFQADLLDELNLSSAPVRSLIRKVKSGDPENIEAQAARHYWRLLFGKSFRRDRAATGTNAYLNYGYTILRSAVVRGILAAGLHPTIAINHTNKYNAHRLADDLMEVFRVIVDWRVYRAMNAHSEELTAQNKEYLVDALYHPVLVKGAMTSMANSSQRLATSLAQVYTGHRDKIVLPDKIIFRDETIDSDVEWVSFDVASADV